MGEMCETEDPKPGHPYNESPDPSQPTPTENLPSMKEVTCDRQEIQTMPEEYKCPQCPKLYKSPVGLCKHVKCKHSSISKCDQCTQAFVYHSLLKSHNENILSRRNGCTPTTITSTHLLQ